MTSRGQSSLDVIQGLPLNRELLVYSDCSGREWFSDGYRIGGSNNPDAEGTNRLIFRSSAVFHVAGAPFARSTRDVCVWFKLE